MGTIKIYTRLFWQFKLRFKRSRIGIRQSAAPNNDFIFRDEDLLLFAEGEHERWCDERRRDGWRYAEIRDNDKKLHNCLVPWEQLPEAEKQKDRDVVTKIPTLLKDIGFELFYYPESKV